MKYRLLDILVCPYCQNRFTLTPLKEETIAFHVPIPEDACSRCAFSASPGPAQNCQGCYARNIVEGVLSCSCGRSFPIIDSVPILLPEGQQLVPVPPADRPRSDMHRGVQVRRRDGGRVMNHGQLVAFGISRHRLDSGPLLESLGQAVQAGRMPQDRQ